MRTFQYTDPRAFQDRVLPLLLEHECENCVLIGIIGRLIEGKSPTRTGAPTVPLMLAVEDDTRVVAAAIQTPPHALLATPLSEQAAETIASDLHDRAWTGIEFVATVPSARLLADRWRASTGRDYSLHRKLRVFRLDRVIDPPPVPGALCAAIIENLELLAAWSGKFARYIGEPLDDPAPPTRRSIEEGRLHVWIDEAPRAICAWAGPTPNGVRINQVYTPPELRGRGYASSATAELSRRLLASGRKFCFLFTDAANPTPNSIYRKIGYRHVADLEHLKFNE